MPYAGKCNSLIWEKVYQKLE